MVICIYLLHTVNYNFVCIFQESSHTWKWFDDSSGRWCKYSLSNNKTIDDAYQAGETNIR